METRGNLKKALLEWLDWFEKFSNELIPRDKTPHFQEGLCLALTGVRRSGKTSLAVQIAKELGLTKTAFYFNFEDPIFFPGAEVETIPALLSLFEEIKGFKPTLVILDEVQHISGWERWVRKAVDTGSFKVIVTGSSSELLSSEIATSITGRAIEQKVWPLSFVEYLAFRKSSPTSESGYLRELDHYFRWGGFPKAVLTQNETDRIFLLKQYLSDIVLRDIVSRHQIKNQHSLQQLVTWYLTGMSCLHSYTAIRKAFGVSIELAASFTRYLEEAFLAFEMGRYHPNLKVQARDQKKIYVIDAGLRTVSLLSEKEDWGRIAENNVYIELRRRGKELYYFKGKQEVDFVLTELGKPQEAIQVTYSDLKDPKTKEREVSALIECLAELNLPSGKILTRAYEDQEKVQGKKVEFIPLYRWFQETSL